MTIRIQDRALITATHLADARREWVANPNAATFARFQKLFERYENIVLAYKEIAGELDRHTE